MRRICCFVFVLTLANGGIAGVHAQQPRLLGNSGTGLVYDVSLTTGAASDPRPTGINYLVGIAADIDGTLFGLTTFASNPANSLIQINPETAEWTLVGATGLTNIFEGDLGFDPTTHRLYGVQESDTVNLSLFELDRETGAATLVGVVAPLGVVDLSAMVFDDTGNLYILDSNQNQLLTVDPHTAQVLNTVNLPVSFGYTAGMAFERSSRTFYVADGDTGATNMLYTLDPTTGVMLGVGSLGIADGCAGLSFLVDAVFVDGFESGDMTRWSDSVP